MRIYCDGERNPLGIDNRNPVFSWSLDSLAYCCTQCSFTVRVADRRENLNIKGLYWEYREESDRNHAVYQGPELLSSKIYYWNVQVRLDNAEVQESETGIFETSFLKQECWKAKWISIPDSYREADSPPIDGIGEIEPDTMNLQPVYQIRKDFLIEKKIERARIYVTAHGIYLPFLDGVRVGTYELAPEHTWYPSQLLYQIYEVDKLEMGTHTLAFLVADGWYAGRIGFDGDNCQYGDTLSLLCQMEILYEDGTKELLCSDESWKYEQSAYEYGDLFIGERYDARLFKKDFFEFGYISKNLKDVKRSGDGYENLKAQPAMHIQVTEEIEPVRIWEEGKGAYIVDFGVTLAGKYKIGLTGKTGTEIRFECTEVLDRDGSFIKNIRESYKNQTDIYICSGNGNESYEPMFTYHGFRYLKITGLSSLSCMEYIRALPITSKMRMTGDFSCSDERLNQLQKNIVRSQVSNMISIPTDCPQREKAGWTGDVQVFAPTACFLADMRNFYKRWLSDMRAQQDEAGRIPIIIPFIQGYKKTFDGILCSAGWGDAAIMLPWTMYQRYGDVSVLLENYKMMERWLDYITYTAAAENPEELQDCSAKRAAHLRYIWNTGFHFGDWLTPSASMNFETGSVDLMQSAVRTMNIVPTLFFYNSTILMEKISSILGFEDRQAYYTALAEHIQDAFDYEYIDGQGEIKTSLQGIYVLALAFGILKPERREKARKSLVKAIEENGGRLDTGFLSVPYILDVLKEAGEEKWMYTLFFQEECPSWLYEIKKGATSMWESWQAILPDGTCSHLSMNHYAFGCVGDWMYRCLAGIQALEPGYKKIRFVPALRAPLQWVKGSLDSVYGNIFCGWKKENGMVFLDIEVPVNTTAQLELRGVKKETLQSCKNSHIWKSIKWDKEKVILSLPSGSFHFKAKIGQ